MLTHPLITRSIEQAQKRVELQNFQARKRLLDYDDVMNQQREVIYSLRSFALEGGEELKGEALKMIEKAITHRVETTLAEYEDAGAVGLRPAAAGPAHALPAAGAGVRERRTTARPTRRRRSASAVEAATQGVLGQAREPRHGARRDGQPYGDRLLSLVMLNVLDEKWKDHLYDLDQLRNAIHYRSWGQKDPLIEYKQEAYTMFVDLMNDIYNTFTERFLKVQLVFEPPPPPPPPRGTVRERPTKRYNALGILEDIPVGRVGGYVATAPTARSTGFGRPRRRPRSRSPRERTRSSSARAARVRCIGDTAAGQRRLVDGRPQRSVSVWVGEEVQEVPRRADVSWYAETLVWRSRLDSVAPTRLVSAATIRWHAECTVQSHASIPADARSMPGPGRSKSLTIRELPRSERPRERLVDLGASALS